MGGDCLNTGCVPSKALIRAAHNMAEIQRAAEFGVSTGPIAIDFNHMTLSSATVLLASIVLRVKRSFVLLGRLKSMVKSLPQKISLLLQVLVH